MRKRTQAREFALQILYKIDITKDGCTESLSEFWSNAEKKTDGQMKEFTERLVKGVMGHVADIDSQISKYAQNWQLKRMAVVDRNILRLGCFELLYCEDVPPKVSINEAIDLAKKYSGLEAGKFVNGILDKIKSSKN
ncbi:MAG: transcription antitermination factor NusB [Candidatus Omnitrophica bacterium]|nr:transcription antitermination factor NusB [Candidatus Omnitrophota bacterium]MDD5610003.1 transcription antitermination factor NusB [Candidatus Omnitrophota bacterium]